MSWFSINHVDGIAFVTLRDDIGSRGVRFADFAERFGSPRRAELRIESNGGDCETGLRLFELLRDFPTEVLIAGGCASSAVTVAMAGTTVRVERGSRILIHSPVSHVCGTPEELRSEASTLEGLAVRVRDVIASRTGQQRETVAEWLSRDTWFDAEEAVRVGLADEIAEPPARSLPATSAAASGSGLAEDRTDAERLFGTILTAFDRIRVCDRERFGRELAGWFQTSVREEL